MKLFIIISLFFFDFLTKKIINYYIEIGNIISINNFLDFTHIHNYGISFGLFAGFLPIWLIIILGTIITIILFYWMIISANKLEKWGILLIISGAISNIGDRLLNGYVIDFIFFNYRGFYWPAFNFADVYISIGILIIIVESIKMFKKGNINK